MKHATKKEIVAAVRAVVGFVPVLRVGERMVDGKHIYDMREWMPADAEMHDNPLLDAAVLRKVNARPGGYVLDLYVYTRREELETNVTIVVSADGDILACYDSVGHFGSVCDRWWCEMGAEVRS